MNSWTPLSATALGHPHASPPTPLSGSPVDWAGAASGAAPLLRAEVAPDAQGLSVQAHAERVLAQLIGDAAGPCPPC